MFTFLNGASAVNRRIFSIFSRKKCGKILGSVRRATGYWSLLEQRVYLRPKPFGVSSVVDDRPRAVLPIAFLKEVPLKFGTVLPRFERAGRRVVTV